MKKRVFSLPKREYRALKKRIPAICPFIVTTTKKNTLLFYPDTYNARLFGKWMAINNYQVQAMYVFSRYNFLILLCTVNNNEYNFLFSLIL